MALQNYIMKAFHIDEVLYVYKCYIIHSKSNCTLGFHVG